MARNLRVHARGTTLLGAFKVLDDQNRAAFARYVAVGTRIERSVGRLWIKLRTQTTTPHLTRQRVWRDWRFRTAADHHIEATSNQAPRMTQRIQAAGALGNYDRTGASNAMLDRDLAGARRVEPGYRLIRTDEDRAFAPQTLNLTLPKLVAAGPAGCNDAHAEWTDRGRIKRGIFESELGRRERHPRPTIHLHHQPLLEEVGGLEAVDLAGQAARITGSVEATNGPNGASALLCRAPVRRGADSSRRDDANACNHRARCHRVASRSLLNTIADWNPPNPLPVDKATSTR